MEHMEAERAANLLARLGPDPGGFLEGCESPHPCDSYLCQSGRYTASHVITGNIHLSMQYYVGCGSTHIVLRHAAQVDISKGDGKLPDRLGPGYLLHTPYRRTTDCRDLIMFTHSLEFPYRDTRMRQQDPKCCFWQEYPSVLKLGCAHFPYGSPYYVSV